MLSSQEASMLFAIDRLSGNGHVRAAHDFLDLEGRDCVAQDVPHVGGVPIEAIEFIYHA